MHKRRPLSCSCSAFCSRRGRSSLLSAPLPRGPASSGPAPASSAQIPSACLSPCVCKRGAAFLLLAAFRPALLFISYLLIDLIWGATPGGTQVTPGSALGLYLPLGPYGMPGVGSNPGQTRAKRTPPRCESLQPLYWSYYIPKLIVSPDLPVCFRTKCSCEAGVAPGILAQGGGRGKFGEGTPVGGG